jgi:hypothetical protein
MKCWVCGRPSNGICRFCGRAICSDCAKAAKTKPFILALFKNKQEQNAAIVVEDALYCGVCKPREQAIVLRNLE